MSQVLLTLGALTLGGSAAVVLLALAGRSTRGRYEARWRCLAWLVLCLRLAVPLPLFSHGEAGAPIQMEIPNPPAAVQLPSPLGIPENAPPPAAGQSGQLPPGAPSDGSAAPAAPQKGENIDLPRLLLSVWLAGAAAALLWSGWAHLRFLAWLRRWSAPVADQTALSVFQQLGDLLGLRRKPRLLVCQGLKVPMLAGMLRPAILLPQGELDGDELAFSLLHELTHYRRRDVWLKALALWVNALYWFDPLMWYMVRLVERDTELACDEDALRAIPQSDFAAYGRTILDAVARLQDRERSSI